MKRAIALFTKPAVLIVVLLAVGWAMTSVGLGDAVQQAGAHGPAVFAGFAAMACALGVPRQVVAYAGGLAFGFWEGAALGLLSMVLGCVANFVGSRLAARDRVAAWLERGQGRQLQRFDRFLSRNAFTATLTLRLLPVGSNLVTNVMAGVSGVRAIPFVIASALGYVPQTVVFALLGDGVRVEAWVKVGLALLLFAVSGALGLVLLQRSRGVL